MIRRLSRAYWIGCALLVLTIAMGAPAQSPQTSPSPGPAAAGTPTARTLSPLEKLLEGNVKAEWDAFKNKNKTAYSDLLAEDFVAVEDDGQGERNKSAAVAEIDRSVIDKYYLFALHVRPLDANTALVTYELTMAFPPKAVVRMKRVLISEVWIKRQGQWKMLHYQETRTR
jgi:hypothetical protein